MGKRIVMGHGQNTGYFKYLPEGRKKEEREMETEAME